MSESTLKRLGAATVLMTVAVFLSRVVGYLREVFVAGTLFDSDVVIGYLYVVGAYIVKGVCCAYAIESTRASFFSPR